MDQPISKSLVLGDRSVWSSAVTGLNGRQSRKRLVLEAMQQHVDWAGLWAGGESAVQAWEQQNPGFSALSMLKIHCLQQWFGLTDIGMEEALLDMPLYRDFADVPSPFALPDSRRMRRFREVLKNKHPGLQMPAIPADVLASAQTTARSQRSVVATPEATIHVPAVVHRASPQHLGGFVKGHGAHTVCKQPLLARPGRGRRMLALSETGHHRQVAGAPGKATKERLAALLPRPDAAVSLALSDEGASKCELLSKRELQTLLRIAAGKRLSDIAEDLMLSPKTVSVYRARMLEKLQLTNNAQLTVYAIRQGLI